MRKQGQLVSVVKKDWRI